MKRIFLMTVAAAALLAGAAGAAELKFKPGEDAKFNWASFEEFKNTHDLKGQTLSVFGPWLGPDRDLVLSVLAYFEDATGARVEYAGSDSFEQQIVIDTQAGSAANIAVFPQPGLAADLAAKGFLAPMKAETAEWLRENYAAGDSWVDLGSYKGKDGYTAFFAFP